MGWEADLLNVFGQLKQEGGVDNVFVPAKLVSTNPPVVNICGVNVSKQLHMNPAMVTDTSADAVANSMAALNDALEQAKDVEEVPEFVELIQAPLSQLLESILEFMKKSQVNAGDTVMVRQNGNDLHIMSSSGG